MKKYLALAAAVGFAPAMASAQMAGTQDRAVGAMGPVAGDREVIVSGFGRSDGNFDTTTLNVNGWFGQYLTDQTAVGIRQGIGFQDLDDGSIWDGSTLLFAQWHFGAPDSMVRPYVGLSAGGIYGENFTNQWTAGPEFGAKWYVQPRTFILTHVDYQWTFRDVDDADDLDWDDGVFNYQIGVGYNF